MTSLFNRYTIDDISVNRAANKVLSEDSPAHDWYRFVLSYPPHLVRDYVNRFGIKEGQSVLDPFSGTGTTVVECKKLGIQGLGVEAHPLSHFAGMVKVDWSIDPDQLLEHSHVVADAALAMMERQGISDEPQSAVTKLPKGLRSLPAEQMDLLLKDSICPLPLHKTLVLLECLSQNRNEAVSGHQRLALAKALVSGIGNLRFGPEVGITKPKVDVPTIKHWLKNVGKMAEDIRLLRKLGDLPRAQVLRADSRDIKHVLEPNSVDAVITSPPYPNEKDYTRTTRLESVLLGFLQSKAQLQEMKRELVRSNTRTVYKGDTDDQWVSGNQRIETLVAQIDARRIELGKTSGFERLYGKVTGLYFGGMARHLAELRTILRPGARLAYVVGDQASFFRILIRTGELLAEIAQGLGYEVEGIDLFRTRLSTVTKEQMREEVVLLRWPGTK